MAANQAPPSLRFSRQEHWSGLPFPSPMHEREKWKWSRSVVSNSSDAMDCSLPGSFTRGIFQAKVLEWVPYLWINKMLMCFYIYPLIQYCTCSQRGICFWSSTNKWWDFNFFISKLKDLARTFWHSIYHTTVYKYTQPNRSWLRVKGKLWRLPMT